LVDDELFSATIVMTLVTTMITPPLLRVALSAYERAEEALKPAVAQPSER
jgi:hypothetical protein